MLRTLFGKSHRSERAMLLPGREKVASPPVESALACNIRCIMCPWKEYRANAEHRGIMPETSGMRSALFSNAFNQLISPAEGSRSFSRFWSSGLRTQKQQDAGAKPESDNGLLCRATLHINSCLRGLDWICVSFDAAGQGGI